MTPNATDIPNPLMGFALAYPQATAVIDCKRTWSSHNLQQHASGVAQQLISSGFKPGQSLGVLGEPDAEWLAVLWAIWSIGGVAAPLNHRQTGQRLRFESEQLELEGIICSATAPEIDIDGLQRIRFGEHQGDDAALRLETYWRLDQPLLKLLTSGTTGQPSVVTLTAAQMLFNAVGSLIRLGHHHDDVWLNALPENHIAAVATAFRCALNQIALEQEIRFDADRVRQRLDSGDISLVSLVPTMLERVLDVRPEEPLHSRVRAILLGGAPCSTSLWRRCQELNLPIAVTWGMSEAASQICTRRPGDLRPLQEGIPVTPFARVNAAEAQLVVEGPIAPGGRFVTSDQGFAPQPGSIVVTGRADDVIVRGGENLDPTEIANVVMAHPGVAEAVVVGIDDATLGQVPVAAVVRQQSQLTDASLVAHCRERLQSYQLPAVIFLEQLPRNAMGKVDRAAITRRLREHLHQEVDPCIATPL